MSTRSGKRIHKSTPDKLIAETDAVVESEPKIRSKKQKNNSEVPVKKKNNYVMRPVDDDTVDIAEATDTDKRTRRRTLRHTLKEINDDLPVPKDTQLKNDYTAKKTRKGKKIAERDRTDREDIENIEKPVVESVVKEKQKSKKKKKNEKMIEVVEQNQMENQAVLKKKGGKKKKKSNSMLFVAQTISENGTDDLNTSNMSVDSFHSAAGSPVDKSIKNNVSVISKLEDYNILSNSFETNAVQIKMTPKQNDDKELNAILNKTNDESSANNIECTDENEKNNVQIDSAKQNNKNLNLENKNKKRRKSAKRSTFDMTEKIFDSKDTTVNNTFTKDDTGPQNATFDKELPESRKSTQNPSGDEVKSLDSTFDKSSSPKTNPNTKSLDTTFDKDSELNTIFINENQKNYVQIDSAQQNNDNLDSTCNNTDFISITAQKTNKKRRKTGKRSTFDMTEKICETKDTTVNNTFTNDDTGPQNATFDKELPESRKSTHNPLSDAVKSLDSTFDKSSSLKTNPNAKSLDTTFDKDNNSELNIFDKIDKNNTEISKGDSKKSSLISSDGTINITDDKSFDNSRISITSDESKTEYLLNHTPVLIESSIDESCVSENNKQTLEKPRPQIPLTPLKREGTFTKEEPEATELPKPKISAETTPTKRFSLPSLGSPGCTPFPFSKSSQKEKSTLNVTRSIEKSVRRSSVADIGQRQTKVMFCSPINNPAIVSEVKGRVIKSNLKGSNKSFVFDESVSSEVRSTGRKRSHTHNEVETRAKRKRLADELQHSVDRLSRPRTFSAAAKIPEPGTLSKKAATPSKAKPECKVSRTRLPNFAALHQKQFAKMESLDECQQRKAKRARQLLTPTGSVGIIERTSPQGTPPVTAPPTKEPDSKLQTPSKPKPLTLESLNPGYTRFGFKMNIGINPFTTSKKTESKPKEKQLNGLSRQNTCLALPSLTGATADRKELAKQIVMREKSFTDKTDIKRKESRTIIKGVRTNRRFELQMKLRHVNA